MKSIDIPYFFIFGLILIINLVLTVFLVVKLSMRLKVKKSFVEKKNGIKNETCKADSCGALDPVNDPVYNVKETLKNTLLIEQHLSEKRKYCKLCLVKHFLLSIALLEEAVWMASTNISNITNLDSSLDFYNSTFEFWHKDMESDEIRLQTLAKMRDWRREMMEEYYF